MPPSLKYAVVYGLRVIQLILIGVSGHFFLKIIGNLATGRLLTQVLCFSVSVLVLVASSLTLARLQSRNPDLSGRALSAADRRFDTPLGPTAQTVFKVLLYGFVLLVICYMILCLFWEPAWLP